jgi:integrase
MRLYRRGSVWWCWFYDASGARQCRSTRCHDRRAAESAARGLERAAQDPARAARRSTTLATLLQTLVDARHEQAVAGVRSHATVKFYAGCAAQWLRVLGGDLPAAQLDAATIDGYLSQRRRERTSEHTIAKELTTLRSALRLALRRGTWSGAIDAVMPARVESGYRPRTRALTLAEAQRLLGALEPDRAARVAFILATSARWGETCRAERGDARGDRVHLRGTKTELSDREVPIVSPEQSAMLAFALEHAGGRAPQLFRSWSNPMRDLERACRRAGCVARRCPAAIAKHWQCDRAECADAAITRCTPNDLRRTCATWLRHAGAPLELIAPVMGHRTTTMLQLVYARLSTDALASRLAATIDCSAGVAVSVDSAALHGLPGLTEAGNAEKNSGTSGDRTLDQRIKSRAIWLPKPASPLAKPRETRAAVADVKQRTRRRVVK